MESLMMINYWISGNLLLDKSNMFEANHSIIVFSRIWNFPPLKMAQTSMNPQKPTIHPALSCFIHENPCIVSDCLGASLKLLKDSGIEQPLCSREHIFGD